MREPVEYINHSVGFCVVLSLDHDWPSGCKVQSVETQLCHGNRNSVRIEIYVHNRRTAETHEASIGSVIVYEFHVRVSPGKERSWKGDDR